MSIDDSIENKIFGLVLVHLVLYVYITLNHTLLDIHGSERVVETNFDYIYISCLLI